MARKTTSTRGKTRKVTLWAWDDLGDVAVSKSKPTTGEYGNLTSRSAQPTSMCTTGFRRVIGRTLREDTPLKLTVTVG